MHSTSFGRPHVVSTVAALVFGASALFAAPPTRLSANDPGFKRAAKGVAKGQKLVVDGLLLEKERGTSALELERISVWRPDAVVLVDNHRVPTPKTVYFRGTIDGDPTSAVLLSVREKGGVMGMVFRGDGAWVIGKGRGQGALHSKKTDPESLKKPFACGADDLVGNHDRIFAEENNAPVAEGTVPDAPRDATIAVETDFEYYNIFASKLPALPDPQAAALDYMGDLIGYADLVYSREIDTDMFIGFSRLWTTNTDPWAASDSSGALNEFINYWNSHTDTQAVKRTVAHMLSGRHTGGGVAYLGVLCDAYGSPSGSLSYGYSGEIDGGFDWDGDQSHNPATNVWDDMVVSHEIGHNFNSPHSHDYCNIGGSPDPIDRCWTGCGGAQVGLPSCSSATPFFNGGAGTIMSYCHQVAGYNAIAMTFGGRDDIPGGVLHTCGTLPQRESARMRAHVAQRAGQYPQCFTAVTCGNGNIDPGEQCDAGNLNGATCASQGFVSGTLSCSSSCTFNTSQCSNCGNDVINPGETCDGSALGGKSCADFSCSAGGTLSCNATCNGYDKSLCAGCPPCNDNNVCDLGEDCSGCPGDCASGTTSGAVCGNGLCEAGNGEDCASCPSDCRGVQGGKPSGRYCCGDGGGSNPVTCSDSRCTASGFQCTTVPTSPGSYCCGDDTCSSGEDCGNCAVDCALGAEVCGNGVDDNCSAGADCADPTCSSTPACLCKPAGQTCTTSSQCCSANCRTKGKNAGTCA